MVNFSPQNFLNRRAPSARPATSSGLRVYRIFTKAAISDSVWNIPVPAGDLFMFPKYQIHCSGRMCLETWLYLWGNKIKFNLSLSIFFSLFPPRASFELPQEFSGRVAHLGIRVCFRLSYLHFKRYHLVCFGCLSLIARLGHLSVHCKMNSDH